MSLVWFWKDVIQVYYVKNIKYFIKVLLIYLWKLIRVFIKSKNII